MDQIDFSTFLHIGTALLGVAVVIITSFIRKVIETAVPDIRQKADEDDAGPSYGNKLSRWYNKVIVYYIPVVVGVVLGCFKIPVLFGEIESLGGRIVFAMVVAWFSRDIYKAVRATLNKGAEQTPDSRLPD